MLFLKKNWHEEGEIFLEIFLFRLINDIGKTLDEHIDAKEYIRKNQMKELKRCMGKPSY